MNIQNNRSVNNMMARYFQATNLAAAKSLKNIASGYKINSAADDASGLAIAQKLLSQTTSIGVAGQNTQDAVSMVQVADGAMGSAQDILNRMGELATRASNGILGTEERQMLQAEYDQLAQELDHIGSSTNFNGQKVLDGSDYTMQIGASADETMDISMPELSSQGLGLDKVDLTSSAGANAAMEAIQNASNQVSASRGEIGAFENRLEHTYNNLGTMEENLLSSLSSIRDADMGKEMLNMTMSKTLDQVSVAMMRNAQNLMSYNAMQLLAR